MNESQLIRARQKAERAVKDMADSPLKVAAFQTILESLLVSPDSEQKAPPRPTRARVDQRGAEPDTLGGRIIAVRGEGFFESQKSLSDIREVLGSRGWHYPLTTLSGAMQILVRQRQLRRQRVAVGKKKVWKYSNP
jgi:hypothetical protein